jgi:hypothetical protein
MQQIKMKIIVKGRPYWHTFISWYCLLVSYSFILGSQNVDFFGYLGRYDKLVQK